MSNQNSALKEQYLLQAKSAQDAERYDDMAEAMKKYVTELTTIPLNKEERELFSIAYHKLTSLKRSAIEREDTGVAEKCKLETELKKICLDVLEILSTYLIKKSVNVEKSAANDFVFYVTMQGDYYRYLIDVSKDEERDNYTDCAQEAYGKAYKTAFDYIPYIHPIHLKLINQYTEFLYTIQHDGEGALTIAIKAFDDAIPELDHVSEELYFECTQQLQILRNNLTAWSP